MMKNRKKINLLLVIILVISFININNTSMATNEEDIILKIYGGIGCHFRVENNNNYTLNCSLNLTDSKGEIIDRGTFKVHPYDKFGVDYWFVICIPIRIYMNVNAELIAENQTLIKQGFKIFIFWFFR